MTLTTYTPPLGTGIQGAADQALLRAQRLHEPLTLIFNDKRLTVRPDMTVEGIVQDYHSDDLGSSPTKPVNPPDSGNVRAFPGQGAIRAKYPRTPDMGEISGFGGGYEATCVNMLYAALKVMDPVAEEIRQMIDSKKVKNPDDFEATDIGKAVEEAVMEACHGDCTGAMHGAAMSHAFVVIRKGYDHYASELRKQRAEENGTPAK